MKIAYLTSRYPAVSHTFILREVLALRALGHEVRTFSVRRPTADDVLGPQAQQEVMTTRWLVPPPIAALLRAGAWALLTRPRQTLAGLALACRNVQGLRERINWLCYFVEALLLARWLVCEKCQRLHCHFGNSGSSTGMIAARIAGIPFSMTVHGSELLQPAKFRLADKVRAADLVACVSQFGKAQLMLNCPVDLWPKLHVVRCGLDFNEYEPSDTAHDEPRTRPARPARLLCVGRLSQEKGHPVLLDALSLLHRRGTNFHCTLVGDGPMQPVIVEQLAVRGLDEHVTLTGSLPPEQVADLYRASDIVVLASFSEGVPVVLMEALAHHRCIVATRVGGIPELITHGQRGGLLVAPGDAVELADALATVIADPELRGRLARTGHALIRQRFDLHREAARLVRLFDNQTGSMSPTPPQEFATQSP